MEINLLGSCSGTEPQPARHHTSWVLQCNGNLFWFDAGETCSYTAHLAGLNLLNTKAIFISHPHLDHVGGLPNLLWTIAKLRSCKRLPWRFEVPIYTSSPEQVKAIFKMLESTEFPVSSPVIPLRNAIILPPPVQVEARGNGHLPPKPTGEARSFSFRITAENKIIVYSGDVASVRELDHWLGHCDLLLMETGHHHPCEICEHLARRNAQIGHLVFLHHGRTMLEAPAAITARCRRLLPFPVDAADDGMQLKL